MNSVVRQLLEQKTDVVMVDTGDSYEGICGYYKGTYISYSKGEAHLHESFQGNKRRVWLELRGEEELLEVFDILDIQR